MKIFHVFYFRRFEMATKIFNGELFPNYGISITVCSVDIIPNIVPNDIVAMYGIVAIATCSSTSSYIASYSLSYALIVYILIASYVLLCYHSNTLEHC